MNKIKYILITLLFGCAVGTFAQQYGVTSDQLLPDTMQIGYQIESSSKIDSYSISGVNSKAFEKSPSIDITKALYGKIAGLNVYQGRGSSPDNISGLSIHGHNPLVLID